MLHKLLWSSAALVSLTMLGTAQAADVAAGKAKTETICNECHEAADWQGEGEADLQALIKDVVAGKVKHPKKLQLSDAEIANIAAYWAAESAK